MNHTKLYPQNYPRLLKQMEKLPPFLYLSGAPIPNDEYRFLCVVGSRKYSDYGRSVCRDLIAGLKNHPVVIVSGLAYGIDSLAHRAALDHGLRTIAFPGSGLDPAVIYPREHYRLAMEIVRTGNTLVSPFEPDQKGDYWTFPVRNELMAGISQATLIIEGGKESGTLLTAKNAADLSRDVLAVPGSIYSELPFVPHMLLKDGAIPVTSADDILSALRFDLRDKRSDETAKLLARAMRELPDDQIVVLRELQYKSMSSSELIENLGISPKHLGIIMTKLELFGIISESHGVYRIGLNSSYE